FHHFLDVCPEVRQEIIHHYLHNERATGTMNKCLHYDDWNSKCCVWEWPEQLIICDKESADELPPPWMALWLPGMAFTSKGMLAEVAVQMFRTTRSIDFKYHPDHRFKVVKWLSKFLDTVGGWNVIKGVCFPHIHRYENVRGGIVINSTNPDVDFMKRCANLERISLTFHCSAMNSWPLDDGMRVHKSLDSVLDYFQLRPILDCPNLKTIFLDGIKPNFGLQLQFPDNSLKTLKDLGNWLFDEYKKVHGREIEVMLHERYGKYRGVQTGVVLKGRVAQILTDAREAADRAAAN
ncbi:hypothetical protein P280DRAFT_412075, partial [Massarina eburnea CBS 473.64]